MHLLLRFWRNQSGATAIEYAFIAGLIAMALVGSLTVIGTRLSRVFVQVAAGAN